MSKQDKPQVGDRVEIIEQGISWGEGRVEAEHKIGGRTTGYRVHRDVGVVKVVPPDQVHKR